MKKSEKNKQNSKESSNETSKISRITAILTLIVMFVPIGGIVQHLVTKYIDSKPVYNYESSYNWTTIEDKTVYGDDYNIKYVIPPLENEYQAGIRLNAYYHNLSNDNREITGLKVFAENIVVNSAPALSEGYINTDENGLCYLELYNSGWGESGIVSVDSVDIMAIPGLTREDIDIKYEDRQDEKRNCQSILPDDWGNITLCYFNEIHLYCNGQPVDNLEQLLEQYYEILCEVDVLLNYSINGEEKQVCISNLCVIGDGGIWNYKAGEPGNDSEALIVVVDTSTNVCEKEYSIRQSLPAKSTVELPIYIIPTRSCSMSVHVEFQMMDGETISSDILDDADVVIPYYDRSIYDYINRIIWDNDIGQGNDVQVLWPFATINEHN